jgi:Cu-processing system permease protein
MIVSLIVATDLLREAARRRWFLVLGVAITLCLVVVLGALRLDVVDGTIAASRLAASSNHVDGRTVDVVLRPIFRVCAYLIFYGGLLFGIFSCAEFAPTLLSPGRIEHLLSLPVKRWQLIVGTFIGVWTIASCASLYAAGGLTVILGIKTGVWTLRPIVAGLLSTVAWGAIYAMMLVAATLARSAALSAGVGGIVFVGGIVASNRANLLPLFAPGLGRSIFSLVSLMFPKLTALGNLCARVASSEPVSSAGLLSLLAGFAIFTAAGIAAAVWCLEQQDF